MSGTITFGIVFKITKRPAISKSYKSHGQITNLSNLNEKVGTSFFFLKKLSSKTAMKSSRRPLHL